MIKNVCFGAKIDKNTQYFIAQARQKNLDTNEMELLMEQIAPTETIKTDINEDGFISMGIGKFCGGYCLQTLLKPNIVYKPADNGYTYTPYNISKKTINTIVNNLKFLKENEEAGIYPDDYIIEFKRYYGNTIDF